MITKRTITDLSGQSAYLVRWSLWLPFGLSLKLHKILRADDDRCPHDHPWWFVRVILWGGYVEVCDKSSKIVRRKPWRPWAPWRIYPCGRGFRHRIIELPRGYSLSLVLTGPRAQQWGFYTKAGFMPWRKFVDATRASRVAWCDDGSEVRVSECERISESTSTATATI